MLHSISVIVYWSCEKYIEDLDWIKVTVVQMCSQTSVNILAVFILDFMPAVLQAQGLSTYGTFPLKSEIHWTWTFGQTWAQFSSSTCETLWISLLSYSCSLCKCCYPMHKSSEICLRFASNEKMHSSAHCAKVKLQAVSLTQ